MWQFSLRTLMGMTLAVLLFTWIFGVLPSWVGGLLLISANLLVLPATLVGIVYLPGNYQAFFVGLAPTALIVFMTAAVAFLDEGPDLLFDFIQDTDFEIRLALCLPLVLMMASGWIGVGMRAWGERLKQAEATRSQPQAAGEAVPASVAGEAAAAGSVNYGH